MSDRCPEDSISIKGKCKKKSNIKTQELADEFYGHFAKRKRNDGDEIWVLKDNAPNELEELVKEAHGDYFPDDWRYEFIVESLAMISDSSEPDEPELEPDIYTHDRLKWLGSNLQRQNYVDEAIGEYGKSESIIEDIGMGQLMEKQEIYNSVLQRLKDILED